MSDDGELFTVAPWFVLMQFTGLKDKNGKEIFEGDIIHGPVVTDTPYAAECPSLACFHWYQHLRDAIEEGKQIEVIGNIHESPELLMPTTHANGGATA